MTSLWAKWSTLGEMPSLWAKWRHSCLNDVTLVKWRHSWLNDVSLVKWRPCCPNDVTLSQWRPSGPNYVILGQMTLLFPNDVQFGQIPSLLAKWLHSWPNNFPLVQLTWILTNWRQSWRIDVSLGTMTWFSTRDRPSSWCKDVTVDPLKSLLAQYRHRGEPMLSHLIYNCYFCINEDIKNVTPPPPNPIFCNLTCYCNRLQVECCQSSYNDIGQVWHPFLPDDVSPVHCCAGLTLCGRLALTRPPARSSWRAPSRSQSPTALRASRRLPKAGLQASVSTFFCQKTYFLENV